MAAAAPDIQQVVEVYRALQDEICAELQELDGGEGFVSDAWEQEAAPGDGASEQFGQADRPGGQDAAQPEQARQNEQTEQGGQSDRPADGRRRSYGDTRVLERGELLERAGVNFSCVHGERLPDAATEQKPHLHGCAFAATGVSVVLHPQNPYVPTAHMNVRFLQVQADPPEWWFGGGFDLTPHYGFAEDCRHWHATARACCAALGEQAYPQYKDWCDRYFYLEHRREARGIGGIFFDDLSQPDFPTCLAFAQGVARGLLAGWVPIAERRRGTRWSEREREFQLYRRGRYAEFNLVQDRGTRFGLQFGGRIESILMSLPPLARWTYRYEPEPGSPEALLGERFLRPRNWLDEAE